MNILRSISNRIILYLGWIEIRPLRILAALKSVKWYLEDLRKYSSKTQWRVFKYPCLFDRYEQAGSFGEYFFQDIYVAKQIIELNPVRHIDVGSRVDGFVAHLACIRKVEVLDIRPTTALIDGVYFQQVDISNLNQNWIYVADCVSCLHTIEHIGLGRYGDQINPDGWKVGIKNLTMILKSKGVLWLSVPIGVERVEFNAHRVFDPRTICFFASEVGLDLKEFAYLHNNSIVVSDNCIKDFGYLAGIEYTLGIFKFVKR